LSTDCDSGFSVGVEHIDHEHRQILRRVGQLADAVREGRPEELRGALKFLHASLGEHFANEEGWMAQAGYPGAPEHTRRHAAILEAVSGVRQRAIDQPGTVVRVAAELAEVLDEHMRVEDLKLGRFVTARENLKLLADAGPGAAKALTPLPGTVSTVRPAPPGGASRAGAGGRDRE
jgi:hemerythrin